jgi:hypothetical protein
MTPFDELFLFLPQCILKKNSVNFLTKILNLIHIFFRVILLAFYSQSLQCESMKELALPLVNGILLPFCFNRTIKRAEKS